MIMLTFSRRFAVVALSALALVACGAASGNGATPAPSAGASADGELGHAKGAADAPVTIIEYASPTCIHCKDFHERVKPALDSYVAEGKVRFIYRDYPLNQVDVAAYAVARCAGPDKFFDVLDDLFQNQAGIQAAAANGVVRTALYAVAQRHGISGSEEFDACIDNRQIRQAIADTMQTGDQYNIRGTPTFIINGKLHNFEGSLRTPEGFAGYVDELIAEKGEQ